MTIYGDRGIGAKPACCGRKEAASIEPSGIKLNKLQPSSLAEHYALQAPPMKSFLESLSWQLCG
jgi:hypothetical protein